MSSNIKSTLQCIFIYITSFEPNQSMSQMKSPVKEKHANEGLDVKKGGKMNS